MTPTTLHVQRADPRAGQYRRISTGALVAATLLVLVHGAITEFGALEIAAIGGLAGLLALSFLDRRFTWTPRLMLALSVTYVSLILADIALPRSRISVNRILTIRGMYVPDDEVGYRLTPG